MKILETFVDLLFPKYCLSCRREGVWMCDNCKKTLKPTAPSTCPRCSRIPTVCGFLCKDCKHDTKPAQILSAYDYTQELVEKAVIHLKYAYVEDLAAFMAEELSRSWKKYGRRGESPIVIPIPLHKRRLRERGFNQAESIAKVFAKKHDLLCAPHILTRTQHTAPQVGLSAEERSKNMRGAFSVKDAKGLQGKTILLIDDVFTTGSTLREASLALANAGVKKVTALTFARG